MVSKVRRMNCPERKVTNRKPTVAAGPSPRVRAVSEIAARYLEQLAEERGEPVDATDLMVENVSPSRPGRCSDGPAVYERRAERWAIYQRGGFRHEPSTGWFEIQCRTCRQWVRVPPLRATRH